MKPQHDLPISLRSWSDADLPLLKQTLGTPEMTAYLGGPETEAQLAKRHQRYLRRNANGKTDMMVILVDEHPAGTVGYWESEWDGEPTYEMGWAVLPAFQGQNVATRAIRAALDLARQDGKYRYVHAFPVVDNAPSNAVCRKAGFTFVGEVGFEYPEGNPVRGNNWRFDLLAE